MTQEEEKDLLLKDLCSRLPYGVKAYVKNWSKLERRWFEGIYTLKSVHPSLNNVFLCSEKASVEVYFSSIDYEMKPYLFPLSSMTPKQKSELSMLTSDSERMFDSTLIEIDFYHKHHIDYRGLIPMGLANDATGLNLY